MAKHPASSATIALLAELHAVADALPNATLQLVHDSVTAVPEERAARLAMPCREQGRPDGRHLLGLFRAARGGALEVAGTGPGERESLARLARGIVLARERAERHRSRMEERRREREAERAEAQERAAERQRRGLPLPTPGEQRREREQLRQRQRQRQGQGM